MEKVIIGPDQASILERLETELDNLRLALSWVLEGKGRPGWSPEPGLRLAAALYRFWHCRGREAEGLSWLEALLASLPEENKEKPVSPERIKTWAQALLSTGRLSSTLGKYAQSREMVNQSRALFEQLGVEGRRGLAGVLLFLGGQAIYKGMQKKAKNYWRKPDSSRKTGLIGVGRHASLGDLALFNREYPQAKAYSKKASNR
jgi:hypothetical protein